MEARTELNLRERIGAREQRGMAVVAALTLIVLLSIAALVVDYGVILVTRTEVSKAVDAAALAGVQELPDQNSARQFAVDYVAMNMKRTSSPVPTVSFPAANVIRVSTGTTSPALFSRILGLTDFSVSAVAEATRFDPNVAIIMDRSGSMCEDSHPKAGANCPAVGPWEPFTTVQKIAKQFVDQFSGDPNMTLISFSTTATLDVAMTSNRALVKTAIDKLKPGGYTDIATSVSLSIDKLLLVTGQRPNIIVLMTDGKPNTVNGKYVGDTDSRPRDALTDVAKIAADKGITIFAINYGVQADNDLMTDVAEATEGKFYYAPDNAGLQTAYTDIGAKSYVRLTYVK